MNYRVLLDDTIVGHKAGDIVDLSESDGNELAKYEIVELAPQTETAPAPKAEAPSAAPAPTEDPKAKEPAPKVEAPTETKAADKAK